MPPCTSRCCTQAWLVEADQRGLDVVYRLVETFLTDRASLAAVAVDELRRLVEEGSVTLLGVRPVLEYRQGHISSARSIAIRERERRLTELRRGREVAA